MDIDDLLDLQFELEEQQDEFPGTEAIYTNP